MSDPLVGQLFGERYRLLNVLGRGGMGVVYRAADTRLHDRPCAVKVISSVGSDPVERARFERELEMLSLVRGPAIVQVLDTGTSADGRLFIVMELLEGQTLGDLIAQEAPLPMARVMRVADAVLTALAEAERHDIVHRDLKPANIFVVTSRDGKEHPKVLDFGLAKPVQGSGADLTRQGTSAGTPRYMAPEQFSMARPPDLRTDLYALGTMIYEMLVGRTPFDPGDEVPPDTAAMPAEYRLAWLHMHRAPLPLPPAAAAAQPLLDRLLAKDPTERYGSPAEVLQALRQIRSLSGTLPPLNAAVELSMVDIEVVSSRPAVEEETAHELSTSDLEILGQPPPPRPAQPRWPWIAGAVALLGIAAAVLTLRPGGQAGLCVDALASQPSGARVVDATGRELGTTPLELTRDCGALLTVRLELAGHEAVGLALQGPARGADRPVRLVAVKAPAPDAAPAPPKPDAAPIDAAVPPAAPDAAPAPDAEPVAQRPKRKRPRRKKKGAAKPKVVAEPTPPAPAGETPAAEPKPKKKKKLFF